MAGYFRLWRRKRIAPGVRLNLSKSGLSMTLGPRGVHYTVGPRGTRATLGLPGTGLFYTSYSSAHARHATGQHVASHGRAPAPAAQPSSPGARHYVEPMLPVAKIAVGIGLGLLGLVLLVVPVIGWALLAMGVILLLVGIGQQGQSEWKIRGLLHEAAHHPERADAAVQHALAIDAGNPEALAAAAQFAFAKEDWPQAATHYEQYLAKAPDDWHAEAHLAASYLNAGNPEQAIPHLQKVRSLPALPDESKVSVTNALAAAFLRKNDGEQALEILGTLPLQRHPRSIP